jgi:glycosyltransferase involved in cell wall biosynthesis
MLKVVHVVPHVDQEASGPSYSVPRLCQSLAIEGHEVELMCLAGREIPGVRVSLFRQLPVAGRFALAPAFPAALRARAASVDIVHNHSLWTMPNIASGWAVVGRRARLVTSPRGTLSRWARARSRWIKTAVWPLQRRALSHAQLLHATSEDEYRDIRAAGLRAPVAIVPNGIDIPEEVEAESTPGEGRTLLFLGRVHPVKAVDSLLRAWREVQAEHGDWRLVIAGKGEPAYVRSLAELAARLELERVGFVGPRYGEEKAEMYRRSLLFILPSHTENFGMVVAEALSHGVPAVVSRRSPWSGLVESGSGWWTENDPDSLAATLREAMASSEEDLRQKGRKGREWMCKEFSWDAVGARMSAAYRWLIEGGAAPPWVRPH